MDPNQLENLLGRMPLRKPAATLDRRVRSARPRRRRLALAAAAGLGLAAAVVLAIGYLPMQTDSDRPGPDVPSPAEPVAIAPEHVAEAPPATPQPVRVEANWSTVSYEGMVVPDDRTPLMQFRRQMVEYVETRDEARGMRIQTAVPREEIILVKATVY
jgi:hypothetical protein